MADVRSWRRRKPGSHTREVVTEKLPEEMVRALQGMAADVDRLTAENKALREKIESIARFLDTVNAEYQRRKATAA